MEEHPSQFEVTLDILNMHPKRGDESASVFYFGLPIALCMYCSLLITNWFIFLCFIIFVYQNFSSRGNGSFLVRKGFAVQPWGPEFESSARTSEAEHLQYIPAILAGKAEPGVSIPKAYCQPVGDLAQKLRWNRTKEDT